MIVIDGQKVTSASRIANQFCSRLSGTLFSTRHEVLRGSTERELGWNWFKNNAFRANKSLTLGDKGCKMSPKLGYPETDNHLDFFMKNFCSIFNKGMRFIALAALVNALSSPQSAQAWANILSNENSTVTIQADTPHGMSDWTVDGQTQLYKQWFWYRTGSTKPEKPINTLSSTADQISPSILNTIYSSSSFSIEITYSLLGGASGSGSSAIGENIKVTNLTGNPLDFHFFQYVDFDLGGNHLGDTVWLEKDLNDKFEKAYQKKGNAYFADEIVSPAANHGEVGLSQSILNKLDDSFASTLNDSVGPVTGDAVWGFQWDVLIAGHGSFYIDINKSVYVTPVPEPSALALLSCGAILFGVARRRFSSRN